MCEVFDFMLTQSIYRTVFDTSSMIVCLLIMFVLDTFNENYLLFIVDVVDNDAGCIDEKGGSLVEAHIPLDFDSNRELFG